MFLGSTPPRARRAATSGQAVRRTGTGGLAALVALGTLPAVVGLGTGANAAVVIGENISAFPDRDMVVAVGYQVGEQLLVEVLRDDVVIGTAQGPAVSTPEGVGLEVNHGAEGTPAPGDCWINYTPDIIGGDVIRVTPLGRQGAAPDTMTVKNLAFSGAPFLEPNGDVSVTGTADPTLSFGVEFRRDKPDPRFRRGPFQPVFEAGTNNWKATYRVESPTSGEGLTVAEQQDIALNTASWLAVSDQISETTLAELGEPGGVAAGCTGSADPNTLVGGLEPINKAPRDVTFSGTARAGVQAVTVTVGGLGVKTATFTPDAAAPSPWTLTVPYTELATLPDGVVAVTPHFDTLNGTTRNVVKDTVAPAAPTATPPAGTYTTTQNVTLNKPAGEGTSKLYWEIGDATVPDPDQFSTPYTSQISVSSSQTIKGRVIDAAGNLGAVGTFAYRFGTPPAAPTNLRATAGDARVTLSWTGATGATSYRIYRDDVALPQAVSTTSYIDTGLTNGTVYGYAVTSVNSAGLESARTPVVQGAPVAPPPNPAPTVTNTSPADGTTGVAVGSNVTATFSEAVTGVTSTTFTLRNTATGAAVTAPVTYNSTSRIATLNPGADLAPGTSYTATLTGGPSAIRDSGNAPLTTTTWSFTTAAAAANPAPTVSPLSPLEGATGASQTNNITMRFSEAVQGVSGSTVQLRNAATGALVTSTVSYNPDTLGTVLNPSPTLAAGTVYTVTVTGGSTAIRDIAGAALVTRSWSFTTAGTSTTNTPPTVTSTSPASGATGFGVGNNITATFNEAVQGVSGTTFTLRNATTGVAVTGVVSYDSTSRVATLNPGANLAANTRYTATLTGGSTAIRDTANLALTTTSWSFTTGTTTTTPTTNAPPTVSPLSPSSGATGVSRVNNVTMRFSEAVQGVSGSTVTIRNAATGALVSATVGTVNSTFGLSVDPTNSLLANTRYTVTVTGGTTAIRDMQGAPLTTTSWSFTTGAS